MNHLRSTRLAAARGLSLVAGAMAPAPAFAADELNVSKDATLAGPGLAAHGYDVVSFFQGQPTVGNDRLAIAHNGATYRFASQAALDTFNAAPSQV